MPGLCRRLRTLATFDSLYRISTQLHLERGLQRLRPRRRRARPPAALALKLESAGLRIRAVPRAAQSLHPAAIRRSQVAPVLVMQMG
jgi:hypothetical protein